MKTSVKCLNVVLISAVLFSSLAWSPAVSTPAQAEPLLRLRYVKPGGIGNCSTWALACDLRTALTAAVAGDEIWAVQGTYYPGTAGNRAATFTLKNGVALYGGFFGYEE